MNPLCFVLMPFRKKKDVSGKEIDFDAVYRELIYPAIIAADMEPLRADEEIAGGIIHRPMFERLILCEFAVADLTTANANVFYELGVRHGVRPGNTVSIFGEGTNLPFDVGYLRCIPYKLSEAGTPVDVAPVQAGITRMLTAAREGAGDSPVFDLVKDLRSDAVGHESTDLMRDRLDHERAMREKATAFQDRVKLERQISDRLAAARGMPKAEGLAEIKRIEASLGKVANAGAGTVIDLMLSYRAVGAAAEMVRLESLMADPLRRTVMVREQLGFALNRDKQSQKAEAVLLDLIKTNGPSSETYGLLGRIYKDRWELAADAGKAFQARGELENAIGAYLKGFEADMRDAFPGINAVTLMDLADPVDPRQRRLLPVVKYAVERRMATRTPDYWDRATELELAVLESDQVAASQALGRALALVREYWELETTARNLRLILRARTQRKDPSPWIQEIVDVLAERSKQLQEQGKAGG